MIFLIIAMASAIAFKSPELIKKMQGGADSPKVSIYFPYAEEGPCEFKASNFDFCDPVVLGQIEKSLKEDEPNFNNHFVVVMTRNKYYDNPGPSVVILNKNTGESFPLPFDYFDLEQDLGETAFDLLDFSLDSNQICTKATVRTYKNNHTASLCWKVNGKTIEGDWTNRM